MAEERLADAGSGSVYHGGNTLVADGDGDDYVALGVDDLERMANNHLPAAHTGEQEEQRLARLIRESRARTVVDVSRGIGAVEQAIGGIRRSAIAPATGFLTVRHEIPPFLN